MVNPERLLRWTVGAFRPGDYQDHKLWRAGTVRLTSRWARTAGTVVVPMAVLRPDHLDEILGGLRSDGHRVHHVLLDAAPEVLRVGSQPTATTPPPVPGGTGTSRSIWPSALISAGEVPSSRLTTLDQTRSPPTSPPRSLGPPWNGRPDRSPVRGSFPVRNRGLGFPLGFAVSNLEWDLVGGVELVGFGWPELPGVVDVFGGWGWVGVVVGEQLGAVGQDGVDAPVFGFPLDGVGVDAGDDVAVFVAQPVVVAAQGAKVAAVGGAAVGGGGLVVQVAPGGGA